MKKDIEKCVKRTFEVNEKVYKNFRMCAMSTGKTVKYIINKLLKGFVDGCSRK